MTTIFKAPRPPTSDDIGAEVTKMSQDLLDAMRRASIAVMASEAGPGIEATAAAGGAVAEGVYIFFVVAAGLACLAILNILWIALYFLWRWIKNLPLVGGPAGWAVAYPLVWLGSIISQLDGWVGWAFNQFMLASLTVLNYLLPQMSVPRTRHVTALVDTRIGSVVPLIKDIDKKVSEIDATLQQHGAHLAGHSHGLWSRLHNLEKWTHGYSISLGKVQVGLGHALDGIRRIQHQVKVLQANMAQVFRTLKYLQQQINGLRTEVKRLEHRVTVLEEELVITQRFVSPVGELAAASSLLSPILATGEQGISNLSKDAQDPCRCFKNPNIGGCFIDDLESMAKHLTPFGG